MALVETEDGTTLGLRNGEPDVDTTNNGKKGSLDINIYTTRKTVAQGLMDIALLTANAAQLKYIINAGGNSGTRILSIVLIGTSITLQVIVGVVLILVGRWNINRDRDQQRAETGNNVVVILIFVITVINILVSAFDPPDAGSRFPIVPPPWYQGDAPVSTEESSSSSASSEEPLLWPNATL